MRDSTALSLLRLDEHVEAVLEYLFHLKEAVRKIDDILFLGEDLGEDL